MLNWYVYILEIVLDILQKLTFDSQNVCVSLTLNEMHVELASLITCLINGNITNTSSTHPPEVYKKQNSIIYSKFNNLVYFKKSIHLLEI